MAADPSHATASVRDHLLAVLHDLSIVIVGLPVVIGTIGAIVQPRIATVVFGGLVTGLLAVLLDLGGAIRSLRTPSRPALVADGLLVASGVLAVVLDPSNALPALAVVLLALILIVARLIRR